MGGSDVDDYSYMHTFSGALRSEVKSASLSLSAIAVASFSHHLVVVITFRGGSGIKEVVRPTRSTEVQSADLSARSAENKFRMYFQR